MDDQIKERELTLRFDNLLLRKDHENFWEIVEVIPNNLSLNYERLAYWKKNQDITFCSSRHLDSDIIYNFIKLQHMVEKWLLKKGANCA